MTKRSASKSLPQNPLTVISSLIGVVEVAFAYPVTKLSGSNQTIIVLFMIGFPTILMLCFFGTVWFRPGHLYGPRDYAKDENFLKCIRADSIGLIAKETLLTADEPPSPSERGSEIEDVRKVTE